MVGKQVDKIKEKKDSSKEESPIPSYVDLGGTHSIRRDLTGRTHHFFGIKSFF